MKFYNVSFLLWAFGTFDGITAAYRKKLPLLVGIMCDRLEAIFKEME